MRVFVTGFGPFGDIGDNPSAELARGCGRPHRILPVSYAAVEEALLDLRDEPFDALLMIGVAANAQRMRLETVAHNRIGRHPDVEGVVAGPGQIDPAGPFQLHGGLWGPSCELGETDPIDVTTDAGDYLCNYIYFRAIQTFPTRRVGFLHVPTFETLAQGTQSSVLARVLDVLDGFVGP